MSEAPSNVVTNLSIEETNKIRISLGLKPLKVETPKQKEFGTTNGNSNDTAEVLDTINKLKKKRELNAKLIGKSIAEQLLEDGDDNDEEDDISNWVTKSRQNEKEIQLEKKKSLNSGSKTNNNSKQKHYNESNLQGIKVGNSIRNFEDENEHILTLQDSSVLDDDYEDVLINVNLAEKEKREKLIQGSKKKSKFDKYDNYGNNGILSNYDDDDNDDNSGFILGNDGRVVDTNNTTSTESLKDQVKKNLANLTSYNIEQNSTNSVLSSFYTQEEMDRFKKKTTSNGGKDKKKKKLRKKSTSDNILNELDATTSSDLGSRKNRTITEKEKQEKENLTKREENYQIALNKAAEVSRLTYGNKEQEEDYYEEAEDIEYLKTLTQAKKASILSSKSIVDIINSKKKQQQKTEDDDTTDNIDEITINPTTEFIRSLNPDGLISNYRSSTTTVSGIVEQEDEEIPATIEEKGEQGEEEEEEEEQVKKVEKNAPILPEEPLASSGLSATLRLLAQKGDLQSNANAGSTSKKRGINYDNDESTVIEHKDEFGRIMTRKEAFVKMSQVFHGKKSGKNKMEKRKRLYEEELKKMKMDSTDTPLGMVKSFQTYQEKTNSPYLVLSGGSTVNILKQNIANNNTTNITTTNTNISNNKK